MNSKYRFVLNKMLHPENKEYWNPDKVKFYLDDEINTPIKSEEWNSIVDLVVKTGTETIYNVTDNKTNIGTNRGLLSIHTVYCPRSLLKRWINNLKSVILKRNKYIKFGAIYPSEIIIQYNHVQHFLLMIEGMNKIIEKNEIDLFFNRKRSNISIIDELFLIIDKVTKIYPEILDSYEIYGINPRNRLIDYTFRGNIIDNLIPPKYDNEEDIIKHIIEYGFNDEAKTYDKLEILSKDNLDILPDKLKLLMEEQEIQQYKLHFTKTIKEKLKYIFDIDCPEMECTIQGSTPEGLLNLKTKPLLKIIEDIENHNFSDDSNLNSNFKANPEMLSLKISGLTLLNYLDSNMESKWYSFRDEIRYFSYGKRKSFRTIEIGLCDLLVGE